MRNQRSRPGRAQHHGRLQRRRRQPVVGERPGHGDAAGFATVGIIAKYRDEFEYYIAHGRSKNGGRLEVGVMEQEAAHA